MARLADERASLDSSRERGFCPVTIGSIGEMQIPLKLIGEVLLVYVFLRLGPEIFGMLRSLYGGLGVPFRTRDVPLSLSLEETRLCKHNKSARGEISVED